MQKNNGLSHVQDGHTDCCFTISQNILTSYSTLRPGGCKRGKISRSPILLGTFFRRRKLSLLDEIMMDPFSSSHNNNSPCRQNQTTDDGDGNDNDNICYDEEYVNQIKERFESCFEPKYGGLWRNMIETQQVKVTDNTASPRKPLQPVLKKKRCNGTTAADHRRIRMGMSNGGFLEAIQSKQKISIAVPTSKRQHDPSGNDCDCGCVPPILDWEDDGNETVDNKENHNKISSIMRSIDREPKMINKNNGNRILDQVEDASDYETTNESSSNRHGGEVLDGSHETSVAPWDEMETQNEGASYQHKEDVEVYCQPNQDELSWNHENLDNPLITNELSHDCLSGASCKENAGKHGTTNPNTSTNNCNDLRNDQNTERRSGERLHSRSNDVRFDASQVFQSSPSQLSSSSGMRNSFSKDAPSRSSQNEMNDDVSQSNKSRDESSNSSGSTRVHFDISHIVQSSPERSVSLHSSKHSNVKNQAAVKVPIDVDCSEKKMNESFSNIQRAYAGEQVPEDNHSVLAPNMSSTHCQNETRGQDNGKERKPGDEDFVADDSNSSESSASTRIHFDISHLVQSPSQTNQSLSLPRTPSEWLFEPETSPRLSPSGTLYSPHSRQSQEDSFVHHDELGSRFPQHELSNSLRTPSDNNRPRPNPTNSRKPTTTPKDNSPDSVQNTPWGSMPRSSRVDMTDSGSAGGDSSAFNRSGSLSQSSEASASNVKQPPASNTEKSLLDGSVLVDLLDSESENEDAAKKQNVAQEATSRNFSKNQIKPRPSSVTTRRVIKDESENDTESDSGISGQEQEWNENALSSECSFQSPDDDSDSLNGLIEATKKITLSIDSAGSSDDEAESAVRSVHKREMAKQKMTKTTFRRKRDALTNQYFAEFGKAAFSGLLSSVDVTWSNKLRTTAGQTRLKRSMVNMTPGVPQIRSASIELSTKVLDNPERLRTTLLHEMVHAAAWIIDGVSNPPHGQCFKKWAKTAMRRIPNAIVTTTHSYEIEYRYTWVSGPSVPQIGIIEAICDSYYPLVSIAGMLSSWV